MEDIIAIVTILVAVVAGGLAIRAFLRNIKKREEAEKRAEEERRRAVDAYWEKRHAKDLEARQKERAAVRTASVHSKLTEPKLVPTSGVSTPKEVKVVTSGSGRTTYLNSPTQEVQSYNSRSVLDDVADIAMIANTIHHWNDNERRSEPEPVREERSVGVSKTESSWGFDDDDSRKSVSSSFSSSWSSSDSDSSSSWSSSDSGPSSDW